MAYEKISLPLPSQRNTKKHTRVHYRKFPNDFVKHPIKEKTYFGAGVYQQEFLFFKKVRVH